jgi:superfamily II DNA or RNA helicase
MLVIAMSNQHSAAMLRYIQERFPEFRSGRIGQDVPEEERSRLLADYREGRLDVMTQVDMIGEGTDIKTISVIVKADLTRAQSKTMRQIFRGMRYFSGFSEEANVCDIYASNDAELAQILEWIPSEERQGVALRRKRADDEERQTRTRATTGANARASAISAVHLAAIRKFNKNQEQMSIPELQNKRAWLERCLSAGKILP